MANLNETDEWFAGIYQLEEDDPVLGGPAGIDNLAPRQLAGRSLYQRLRSVTPWSAVLAYPAAVAYVGHAGTTWKSVAASTGVEPGTDDTKWVRWAHTASELEEILEDAIEDHVAQDDPHGQYALWSELGHGQCRLSVVSATSLVLQPRDGNVVRVNDAALILPAAGVTISNAGLTASTVYYVYLAGTTAAPSLVLSATGRATAPSGIEVMAGDPTKTLVGMVYVNASGQFNLQSNRKGIWLLNWFNRVNTVALSDITSTVSFTNTTSAKATTQLDTQFLCWSDESVFGSVHGYANNNTLGNATFAQLVVDGVAWGATSVANAYTAGANFPYISIGVARLTPENTLHTASINGHVNGGTGNLLNGNLQVNARG